MKIRSITSALLIVSIGFFYGCREGNKAEIEALQKQTESMSVERAEDVKIRYTDSARLKAIISTPLMIRFPERKNPYSEMPKGLSAQFYNDQGEPNSRLSANYGINFEQQKLIQLRDSVRVYNTMGEELKSEELYWDQVRKKIYTNTYVVIKRAGDTIRGDGFESNENFTKYRITKPHGRVKLKENIEGDETP